MYAPNKRGQARAVYRSSDCRLVAFSSSGSEEEPAVSAEQSEEEPAEGGSSTDEEPGSDDFSPWPPLPQVFRPRKGAPKPSRFILGVRELFQEPMDLVQTPTVTLKLYMR